MLTFIDFLLYLFVVVNIDIVLAIKNYSIKSEIDQSLSDKSLHFKFASRQCLNIRLTNINIILVHRKYSKDNLTSIYKYERRY